MEERITGVMIYYYFVCSRKLWYFCHQINMEDENENVQLGKLLDENSYKRDDKHIEIDGIINMEDLDKLANGVKLEDGKTAPADVYLDSINKTLKESRVEITIYEGKNRQVRRMFKALGYEVKALKRIAFAGLTLSKLKRGEYRKLTETELLRLRKKIGDK